MENFDQIVVYTDPRSKQQREETLGAFLREFHADETTTPKGVAPRLYVRSMHGWEVDDEIFITEDDAIDYADTYDIEDAPEEVLWWEVWSWGPGGNNPQQHLRGEKFNSEQEADLAIMQEWYDDFQENGQVDLGYKMDTVQATLMRRREELGMTRYLTAKMAGIQPQQLRKIEEGGDCLFSTVCQIASSLELEVKLLPDSKMGGR